MPEERETDFILYGHPESGNAWKAALIFALTDTPFDFEFVDIFKGGTRTPEYTAINRFQEIPVLRHGEKTIVQSSVILTYMSGLSGKFGPRDAEERWRVAEWLAWENQRLLAGPALVRFLRKFQRPAVDQAVMDFLVPRAERAIGQFAEAVGSRPFLLGDRPTIADIACAGYIFLLEEGEFDVRRWPAIVDWRARMAALKGWKSAAELMPAPQP
jgi:glutathione S-transferase